MRPERDRLINQTERLVSSSGKENIVTTSESKLTFDNRRSALKKTVVKKPKKCLLKISDEL